MKARFTELAREEQVSALPPVVVGASVVVPTGLLALWVRFVAWIRALFGAAHHTASRIWFDSQ